MDGGSQDVLTALAGDPRVALALAGAIGTAAVGGVAYILRGVIAWIGAGLDRRREALIAFKRFRVEVQIAQALLPQTNSDDAEARIVAQLHDHAQRG